MARFPGCDLNLEIGYMPDKVAVCVAAEGGHRVEDGILSAVQGIIATQCARKCEPTINALCEAA